MPYIKAVNYSGEAVSDGKAKIISADQMINGQNTRTIFQRITEADKTAAEECVNKHGALVWALAKQITASTEESERAAQEIFLDFWKYAERFDVGICEETDFIVLIARRWLVKRNLQSALASRTNSETSA